MEEAMTTTDEWVGRTIAGKYRVEALLGKGGMGLVLLARHVRLDEHVAIKVLLPAMLEVQGMTSRFLREAKAASKIKSPHVARVTDVDVLPDGTPYMIMEYLDGMSLAALRRQRGRLEIGEAVGHVIEACDAIAEAHSLGIVHRDLKPANLFIAKGRDGTEATKVLDFGISKIEAPGEQDTTKTGQMMGSPKYMAPEQMLSMHDVDGRSDIWSLGAILYDLLVGRTPFVAETTPQLCSLVLHAKPTPPRALRADLPELLETIILRCLEKDRARRFANVAELVAALTPFAPAGMRLPPPRTLTTSGIHSRVSVTNIGTAPIAARPRDVDAQEPPTKSVAYDAGQRASGPVPGDGLSPGQAGQAGVAATGDPGVPLVPSVTPSGAATFATWNASSERPRRSLALGIGIAVAVVAVTGAFALHSTAPTAAAQASGALTAAPTADRANDRGSAAASPTPPTTAPPATAPTADDTHSPAASAAAADASQPAGRSQAATAPGGAASARTMRPVTKGTDSGATQADPFQGRRR
jgi:serine/threonine-protein kinase